MTAKSDLRKKVRAVFISDVHLGNRGSKAKELLKFLAKVEFDQLYIIGDFIDIWQIQAGKMKWRKNHTKVIEIILSISKVKPVYYIIGNHDEEFREFTPLDLYHLHFSDQMVYTSLKGERILLLHGDKVDIFMHRKYRFVSNLGSSIYDLILGANYLNNQLRSLLNKPYWSLSKYLKTKTKNIGKIVRTYESNILKYVKKTGYNHVICGHVHHPDIKMIGNIRYMNTGDWVENCSAIIEDLEGKFHLVNEEIMID